MKHYLGTVFVASLIATLAPTMANATDLGNVNLNGFLDMVWTVSDSTDEGINGTDGHFDTTGEIDIASKLKGPISMRLDANLNSAGGSDSGRLEQAFLNWDIQNNLALKAGVFNNSLSWEKEDAPDMYQITHGQLYNIWDISTSLDGNNLAGAELSYTADIFKLSLAYLNDLGDVADENSVKIAGEFHAMPNLNIVVGYITQKTNLEDIIDINVTWNMDNKLTLGFEAMMPDQLVDNAYMIIANYKFTNEFSGTARYDVVSYDVSGSDNTTSLTIAGLYTIDPNLFANAEIRVNSDNNVPTVSSLVGIGEGDGNTVHLELIATF